MPLPISDRKLSALYQALETSQGKIDDSKALELLSTVADQRGYDSTRALTRLTGFDRGSQIQFIQKGMSATEKKDLGAILDSGTVPMDPTARSLFEAVLGRSPVPPPPPPGPVPMGPVTITGSQQDGLSGIAKPG